MSDKSETTRKKENIESQIAFNKRLLHEWSNDRKQKFQEIKDFVAKAEHPVELYLDLPPKLDELSLIGKECIRINREILALEDLIK